MRATTWWSTIAQSKILQTRVENKQRIGLSGGGGGQRTKISIFELFEILEASGLIAPPTRKSDKKQLENKQRIALSEGGGQRTKIKIFYVFEILEASGLIALPNPKSAKKNL